jgi:hypothetical protein
MFFSVPATMHSSIYDNIYSTATKFVLSTNPGPSTTTPDSDAILSVRTPSCLVSYGPSSFIENALITNPMDNDQYLAHLHRICPLLKTWRTEIKEIFVDESKLSAIVRADHFMTLKERDEPSRTDCMWLLTLTESGDKVEKAVEFMDSAASLKFMGDVKATAMQMQNGQH